MFKINLSLSMFYPKLKIISVCMFVLMQYTLLSKMQCMQYKVLHRGIVYNNVAEIT